MAKVDSLEADMRCIIRFSAALVDRAASQHSARTPENLFGRVLPHAVASHRRLVIWGVVFDSFRPDRYDLIGAAVCLVVSR